MPTLLIDGKWVSSIAGATIDVINPCDAKVFSKIDRGSAADIDLAVHAARRALHGAWGRMTATERGRIMMKFADLIVKHADEIAKIEAQDTGKPMTVARNDIVAVARYFEFYGSAADKIHGEQIPYLNNYNVQVIRVPHGVTAHIITEPRARPGP
jgi:aldehyde dehydrogenase (NAD+)